MAITKEKKQAQVQDLTTKMSAASSVMLAHYIGLSVAEVSELRNMLRENNAEMKVSKKTLMKIAAKDAGLPEIDESTLDGPISMIFSFGDPLSGAQIAFKFAKTHKQVQLVGGVFDGKVLSKAEAMELAEMPNRDQLLSMFVGMIQSPLVSFASICNSPLTGFARCLQEMADKGGFGDTPASTTVEEAPAVEALPTTEEKVETSTEEKPQEAASTEASEPEEPATDETPTEETNS
ncbi:MAG: 50S ribosomal protein L10 [bacterium]|nr:50S ribosomal protein L10 [bacterium]